MECARAWSRIENMSPAVTGKITQASVVWRLVTTSANYHKMVMRSRWAWAARRGLGADNNLSFMVENRSVFTIRFKLYQLARMILMVLTVMHLAWWRRLLVWEKIWGHNRYPNHTNHGLDVAIGSYKGTLFVNSYISAPMVQNHGTQSAIATGWGYLLQAGCMACIWR